MRRDWALVTALIFSLLLMLPAASTMAAGESVVAMRPAAGISVTKVSLTSPVKRGAKAQLVIATKAKAKCTIKVTYKSGSEQGQRAGAKDSGQQRACQLVMDDRNQHDTGEVADRRQVLARRQERQAPRVHKG